jgi:hypothetical protein
VAAKTLFSSLSLVGLTTLDALRDEFKKFAEGQPNRDLVLTETMEKSISLLNSNSAPCLYSCDAMIGIEEAFIEGSCLYCGDDYTEVEWLNRGMHLVIAHRFGKCESGSLQRSWVLHRDHLLNFHDGLGVAVGHYQSKFLKAVKDSDRSNTFLEDDTHTTRTSATSRSSATSEISTKSLSTNHPPSCLSDLDITLEQALLRLNDADLDPEIDIFDAQEAILKLFLDVNWKLNSLEERYHINGLEFPVASYSEIKEPFVRSSPLYSCLNPVRKLRCGSCARRYRCMNGLSGRWRLSKQPTSCSYFLISP